MHLWALETTELFAAAKLVFLLVSTPLLEVWDLLRGSDSSVLNSANRVDHLKCRVQFLLLVHTTFTHGSPQDADHSGDSREDVEKVCKQDIPKPRRMFKKDPTALLHACPVSFLQSPPCYQSSSLKWEVSVATVPGLCFSAVRRVRPLQGQVTGILRTAVTPLFTEGNAKSSLLNMNSDKHSPGRGSAAACTAHFPFYSINLLVLTAPAVSFYLLNLPMSKDTKPVYSHAHIWSVLWSCNKNSCWEIS